MRERDRRDGSRDGGGGGDKHGRGSRNGRRGTGVGGAIRRGGAPRGYQACVYGVCVRVRRARMRVCYVAARSPPPRRTVSGPRAPPHHRPRVGARNETAYVCVRARPATYSHGTSLSL